MLCGHAFSTLCLSAACLLACTFPCACASSSGYAIHTVTDAATPFGSAHATLNHLVLGQTLHEKNETSHFLPPLRGVIVRPSSLSLGKAKKGSGNPQGNRMVMQDFVRPEEAARLRRMGMSLYQGQTAKEETAFSFQVQYLGLSPQAAARAVETGSISTEDAQLYFTVVERIRQTVTEHFKLKTELFHHFTHIVCRSPNIEAPLVSEGAYLPAHADNCNLNVTTGQCHHSSRAFTWRHYTSLLYLHEDFEGGNFFFSHSTHNVRPESWVRPRTGQLLTFTAGQENIHGVTHTVRGVRCILEQWFTIDSHYQDRLGPAHRSITHRDTLS